MRVTKFGHSCFLIEEGGARILFDPGNFSTAQNELTGIDAVLITHEHPDHFSPDSLKTIIARNPGVAVYTNTGTGESLAKNGIAFTELNDSEKADVKGVPIEGFGVEHACIHDSIPLIKNTGYMIARRLYYPGDSFYVPPQMVEILALPVAAPWLRIAESADYAAQVKPKVCFPVHDGMLRPERVGSTRFVPQKVLAPLGIEFRDAIEGTILEF